MTHPNCQPLETFTSGSSFTAFKPDYDYAIYMDIPDLSKKTILVIRSRNGVVFQRREYPYKYNRGYLFGHLLPEFNEPIGTFEDWAFNSYMQDGFHPEIGHTQDYGDTVVYIRGLANLQKAYDWIAEKEGVNRSGRFHDDASWCFEKVELARWVNAHIISIAAPPAVTNESELDE